MTSDATEDQSTDEQSPAIASEVRALGANIIVQGSGPAPFSGLAPMIDDYFRRWKRDYDLEFRESGQLVFTDLQEHDANDRLLAEFAHFYTGG